MHSDSKPFNDSDGRDDNEYSEVAARSAYLALQSFGAKSQVKNCALPESFCRFGRTISWETLYDSHGQAVPAAIYARFSKKYLKDDTRSQPCHIIYRRNYFAITMSYTLITPTGYKDGNLYVHEQNVRYSVKALGLRLRAVKNHEHGEDVPISVFTAKRGPPIHPPPSLEQKMQPDIPGLSNVYSESTGHGSSTQHCPIYHTFPRLQFRKATENNGVRRKGQSFFRVVIDLRASIVGQSGEREWVKIASTMSGPLLVRGRCPNSFEPYDPNNKKRKPPKKQYGRINYKGAGPRGISKKKNLSTKQTHANVAIKSGSGQRGSHRVSSTAVSSTMPDSISGSQTPTTNHTSVPSPYDSPVMVPRDTIPPDLRLPILNENPQVPQLLTPSMDLTHDTLLDTLDDELTTPLSYREAVNQAVDAQRYSIASKPAACGIDFDVSGSVPDTQDYD